MDRTCDEQATCLPQTAAELLDRTVCLHGWVAVSDLVTAAATVQPCRPAH